MSVKSGQLTYGFNKTVTNKFDYHHEVKRLIALTCTISHFQFDMPYFVTLHITNGAELTLEVLSKPILVDMIGPSPGLVIDGLDLHDDKTFLSSTTEVSGCY